MPYRIVSAALVLGFLAWPLPAAAQQAPGGPCGLLPRLEEVRCRELDSGRSQLEATRDHLADLERAPADRSPGSGECDASCQARSDDFMRLQATRQSWNVSFRDMADAWRGIRAHLKEARGEMADDLALLDLFLEWDRVSSACGAFTLVATDPVAERRRLECLIGRSETFSSELQQLRLALERL